MERGGDSGKIGRETMSKRQQGGKEKTGSGVGKGSNNEADL